MHCKDEDMFIGCKCLGGHYCGGRLSSPMKAQVWGIW